MNQPDNTNLTGNSLFQTNTQANSVIINNEDSGRAKLPEPDDLMAPTQEMEATDDGELDDYMYDVNIARRVEIEKLNAISAASVKLANRLSQAGRCKICTLKPPCRHIPESMMMSPPDSMSIPVSPPH